jgi:hypothetical protein
MRLGKAIRKLDMTGWPEGWHIQRHTNGFDIWFSPNGTDVIESFQYARGSAVFTRYENADYIPNREFIAIRHDEFYQSMMYHVDEIRHLNPASEYNLSRKTQKRQPQLPRPKTP